MGPSEEVEKGRAGHMIFSPGGDWVEDLTTTEKGAAMCGPGLQRVGRGGSEE